MTDFPILDSDRTDDNCPGRLVIAEVGFLEPFIDEADSRCTMPLRVVHSQGADLTLEVGPYTLDRRDIAKLREALRAYDLTENGRRSGASNEHA